MKRLCRIILAILCCILCTAAVAGVVACTQQKKNEGYTATFSLNYSGAPDAIEVTIGEDGKITPPEEPQRDDYIFSGWYKDSIGLNEFSFDESVTSDIRLFAKWTPTVLRVTFNDGMGGKTYQNVAVGGLVKEPEEELTRTDYDFDGWYADAKFNTPFDFETMTIEKNTTIYAKWRLVNATVTFVLYDEESDVQKIPVGEKVARPSDPVRGEEGAYRFVGWTADRAGTTPFDFEAPVTDNISVYAQWEMLKATVTFNVNYESGEESDYTLVDVNTAVSEPSDPVRDGYEFTGWFYDSSCSTPYDFTVPVTDNLTLYAGWTLATYKVTFSLNYADAPVYNEQDVINGSRAEEIDDPVRDGYIFMGWYTEAECVNRYDFADAITGNTTIYAKWVNEDGTSDLEYKFYDGSKLVDTLNIAMGEKISGIPEPESKDGYYFAGWTTEQSGEVFNFDSYRASESLTFYTKWLKGYAFEAEYVNVFEENGDGKHGQGTSDQTSGLGLIISGDTLLNSQEMGISNGYYIGKLYYNGANIVFNITAEEEVDDAVLYLRLTPDWFDFHLDDFTYQVIVNNERIEYGNLDLEGAIPYQGATDEDGNPINGDMYKRPFENYLISVSLHLQEGENTIVLYTNNSNDHDGTFNAETPLVDCIYIFTDTTLTWTECHPENVGQTMDDVTYEVKYWKDEE